MEKLNKEISGTREAHIANFAQCFLQIQSIAYVTALSKGWWDKPREDGTLIALMHSELSEGLEALRHGNDDGSWLMSETISGFSQIEEELADTIIRIMDFAHAKGLYSLGAAILAKMKFNENRTYKHGGKQF